MRLLTKFALAAVVLVNHALAVPLIARPGGAADIIINADDTLNATASSSSTSEAAVPVHILAAAATSTAGQLNIALKNNLASSKVHAYVTGLDVNGALVMLQPNGNWYYPTATSSGVPVQITGNVAIPVGAEGTTTTITLPGYISAGRVWFADGTLKFFTVEAATGDASLVEPSAVNPSDPSANTNWGFIELTNDEDEGLYVNLSFVDFTGLPLGITLTDTSGDTYEALGLAADAVTNICSELAAQSGSDNQDWVDLCVYSTSGTALRALSPYNYLAGINNSAFENYWTAYITKVWTYYETHTLTIDTQAAAGKVACTVSSSTGNLTCAGDNRGYAQPSAADIFGCNAGPFAILGGDNAVHYAIVPRLCAAFHRSTFLLSGGNVQPSLPASDYYTVTPTNWYSSIVHDWQIDGKGYTFPYDDVTPTGDVNESGLLATTDPELLTVIIGGAC
ncbi:glucanase B [Delphinella strobiligena]|nr:glucanase B [Delphinella strobiligena]